MVRLSLAPAVVDSLFVDFPREMVFGVSVLHIQIGSGCQLAAVCGGCGDGAGVHKGHGSHLTLAGLGAFPVGEVPGGVPDGELSVGGSVACTEAGAAEAFSQNGTGGDQIVGTTIAHQLRQSGHGAGIDAEGEGAVAAGLTPEDISGSADIVEGAAGAASNFTLFHPDGTIMELTDNVHLRTLDLLVGVLLNQMENVSGVLLQLVDGIGVAGVHGHSDGALYGGQVNVDTAVIVSNVSRLDFLVGFGTAMDGEILFCLFVRDPDGRPAGGLGGHHVDGVAVLHRQVGDTRTDKFHNLILNVAAFVDRADDGKSHILRANAGTGRTGQVNGDHTGTGKVIGTAYQLLCQLAAALAYSHGAQGAVAGVRVRAQDHPATAGHHLPIVGVDVCHIGGDIDAAILVGGGESKLMVVLVDGAAHGAEGIVTVGQNVGQRERFHAGGPGGLDNANVGDVMGGHGVELQTHIVHVLHSIVGFQDAVSHGIPGGLRLRNGLAGFGSHLGRIRHDGFAAHKINAGFIKFQHGIFSFQQ